MPIKFSVESQDRLQKGLAAYRAFFEGRSIPKELSPDNGWELEDSAKILAHGHGLTDLLEERLAAGNLTLATRRLDDIERMVVSAGEMPPEF